MMITLIQEIEEIEAFLCDYPTYDMDDELSIREYGYYAYRLEQLKERCELLSGKERSENE